MKVETLEALGVVPEILAIWRETVGPELLPVQARAVQECGLFGRDNLIVFAPTSSGKTFIGEMAAVKAARENTKVFYLVPQKALAEEKFDEFRRRYGPAGLRVVVSSRDRREFDADIEHGDFHIAVVVFEKLQALLVSRPPLMESVGLVVVDELQLLTDETRGPALELLLTKLRSAQARPRIVGLSAVLGRAEVLADWLRARLLVEHQRPVELRKGVLCRGVFRYRTHNASDEGTETFTHCPSDERHELVLSAVADLVARGEQALVFVPDRATSVAYAQMLADRVRRPALLPALEELAEHEPTMARAALEEVLRSSIAFHNADLSRDERALVERHFRAGGVRVLFATTTLAVGMNLPVRNVVLEGKRWKYWRQYGRWNLENLTRAEYENMSGRAGRLGFGSEYGRSILVTDSRFDVAAWLDHYASGRFEDVAPTLKDAPFEDHVVDLLASGMAGSVDTLAELLLGSFTGYTWWGPKLSREDFDATLAAAVRVALEGGLVQPTRSGRLAATDLGRACASKGIGVATAIALAHWARGSRAVLEPLEVLTEVGLTPAGEEVYVALSQRERYRVDYRAQVLQRAAASGVADRPVFARFAEEASSVEHEVAKAIKKAVMLVDWVDEVSTSDLEAKYGVWAGAVRRVGEEYPWLVDALAAVGRACGWPAARCAEVEVLAERVLHGVRADAVRVAALRVPGLGRALVRRLVDAGFDEPDALRAANPETVQAALRHRGAFAALWARLHGDDDTDASPERRYGVPGAATPRRHAGDSAATAAAAPEVPALVVDLRERRVTFRGHEIPTRPPHNLQRQPLLALAVLASQPGRVLSMAEIAEGMRRLGGLAKRPVAPDARDLRYKLLRPFKRALAGTTRAGEGARLVESVPGSGLRLNLEGAAEVIPGASPAS